MVLHSCLFNFLVYFEMGRILRTVIQGTRSTLACTLEERRSVFSRSSLLATAWACSLVIGIFLLNATSAYAQWKPWMAQTPRDSIFVHADQFAPAAQTHFPIQQNISTEFYFSGTFGVFSGQDSTGFDARYTYKNPPNWNAPIPLANPPTWNNQNYQVYLQVSSTNNPPSPADSLKVLENSYQPYHEYTAIYPGAGTYFYFHIYDQLNTDGSGSAYKIATGGINVYTARYTAGISVQFDTLAFPTTNVGLSSQLLDSIASFGLDPLQIDSVWIDGPGQSDFNLLSQRGTHFTLDETSTNQFSVSYTPTAPRVTSTATLHIRSSNADVSNRLREIVLTGYSAAPDGKIGPSSLDFGTVRSQTFNSLNANAFNSGNATYYITQDTIIPAPGTPAGIFGTTIVTPDPVAAESGVPIKFTFIPLLAQCYQATAYLWDSEGNLTTILLTGCGAIPNVTASQSSLNFDTLFTNDSRTLNDTITNIGNWTAHVILANLGCADPKYFSFTPPDTSFYLDAGQSRIFSITFHPTTTITEPLSACLEFYFDDGSQPEYIYLNGVEKQRAITYDTNIVNFGRVKVGDALTKVVGVENLSPYSQLFSPVFSPASPVFQLTAPTPNNYAPGTSDSIQLEFQPAIHGASSAWVHIQCNEQDDSIYLFGFGAIAQPVFSPSPVDFGTCWDSSKNAAQTIITDTGDYPLIICGYSISGPDSSEFSLVNPSVTPDTVADSGMSSRTLTFNFTTYAHTGGTVHHANLEIHYCDGTIDTLPLKATEATQSVQFCNHSYDFGRVRVGTTSDTGVCFGNPEIIPLNVDTIWLSPAGIPFSLKDTTGTVPASGHYYDSLYFTPPSRSAFSTLLYAGGGGMYDDSILITGIGAQSMPALSTKEIDFGTFPLQTTSSPQQLTLQDTGDWKLAAKIVKINDPNKEFTVLLQSGIAVDTVAKDSVAVGGSSSYTITFTPHFPDLPQHESELVFYYDDGTRDTVYLIGHDSSNFLAFQVDTLNFGFVRIGTGPATKTLELINTSSQSLTATSITGPALPFTATPNAPITVPSDKSSAIQVTFTPQVVGYAHSLIAGVGSPFQASLHDSVVLEGTGAQPVPKLSVDTLFFDTVAWGRVITRSFTLADSGNWPLAITCAGVTGPNAADFIPTPPIPAATTIAPDSVATYPVTFTATTPIQLTPRVGYITWTMDDGSQFKLVLIANDVPPLHVQLGFPHAYWGRPGDKIAAEVDLQTVIPDSMGIQRVQGTITFDPTIVDGPDIVQGGAAQPGNLIPTSNWVSKFTYHNGSFDYLITSTTDTLSQMGTLFTFMLQLHNNLQEGATSPLIGYDTIPGTNEIVVPQSSTTVVLDSICGTIHLLDGGQPIASFIEQNIPNPFGAGSSGTTLPFDVGNDNSIITIRLLDPTGREVLRPVDHVPFARGRYQVTVDAGSLHSGIYFYEFQADGQPVQMLKMAVE